MKRRIFLLGVTLIGFNSVAPAQAKPKLIIFGRGITSPILNVSHTTPRREMSLEFWLVCNGAEVDRAAYAELFQVIGTQHGAGDNVSTFNLPTFALEMRGPERSEVGR
jgi:hypothetical protein